MPAVRIPEDPSIPVDSMFHDTGNAPVVSTSAHDDEEVTSKAGSNRGNIVKKSEADAPTKRSGSNGNGKGRTWEQNFAALKAYREVTGHANVPYYYQDRALGEFVNKCRKNPSLLSEEQVELLNSINFDWSTTQERLWNEKYVELQAFFEAFCHSKVPKSYDESLCNWVAKQRQIHAQGRMGKARFSKLEKVNFLWRLKQHAVRISPKEEKKWKEKFTRLQAYKEMYGTTAVPFQWEHDKSLGRWVNEMRTQNTRGILRPDRKELLDGMGFLWRINRSEHPGGRPSKAKKAIKEGIVKQSFKEGDATRMVVDPSTSVIFKQTVDDSSEDKTQQSRWKRKVRVVSDSDTESSVQTVQLDYDPTRLQFDTQIFHLEKFKRKNGHVNISENYSPHCLGPWVAAMQCQARAGMLSRSQSKKLLETGVIMRGKDQLWVDQYEQLEKFYFKHGHFQVSAMDDPDLAFWTRSQRGIFRRGKLRSDRRALLEKLDFDLGYSEAPADYVLDESKMSEGDVELPTATGLLAAASAWIA